MISIYFYRRIFMYSALIPLSGIINAAIYNGNGPGQSIINSSGSGDYVSLEDAVDDINASQLTGGDWTFIIESNLVEPQLTLGQNTNGNTITFKPAPGTTPEVIFNSSVPVSIGPSGYFIVGVTAIDFNSIVSTNNIIFDGSNDGTDSRDLTFSNIGNGNESTLFNVIGDSDNTVFKNCNFLFNSTGVGSGGGVRVQSVNSGGMANLNPDNTLFEKNRFVDTTDLARGIVLNKGGGDDIGFGVGQTTIINNEFFTGGIAIIAQNHRSITVQNNQATISSNENNLTSSFINFSQGTTSTDPVVIDISNNEVLRATKDVPSVSGIFGINILGENPESAPNPEINIVNNSMYIEAVTSITSPTTNLVSGMLLRYVDADYNILHNSINVSMNSNYSVNALERTAGIYFQNTSSESDIVLQNNIIRFEGPEGYAISRDSSEGNWFAENNNYTLIGGTAFGRNLTSDTATLTDWTIQTALDSTSTEADPLNPIFVGAGSWTAEDDLRFVGMPFQDFEGVTTGGITLDLDGNSRNATMATKGAFESSPYFTAVPFDFWMTE